MRILLAEDNEMIGSAIKAALEKEKYVVDWMTDGEMCEMAIDSASFDILILDVNLPKKTGLEVLKSIRLKKNNLPVLILTARNSTTQKIEGLDLGADDYLTKPFDLSELFARVRCLVRRSNGIATPVLSVKNIKLDVVRHSALKDEKALDLSPKEFSILKLLMENCGKAVSKSRLENLLYSWDDGAQSNTIEVHIHNLRKKIGNDFIKTVRGFGYILE